MGLFGMQFLSFVLCKLTSFKELILGEIKKGNRLQ